MGKAKPFCISKMEVWEAYKRVKANKGAAGVDGQTIEEFEGNLKGNLYKLWNRMSSGSYFPSAVLRVEIPKSDGRTRPLGIPTVADRIAQMVVKRRLEPELEAHFHEDSYGYRPGRSAHQALAKARERCWRYGWVLDLDVKGFFDNIDHGLLMKAVKKHTRDKWALLYIERWLKAPVRMPEGEVASNGKGTPQGGVISPLLANLFLHYAFDKWMERNNGNIPFERYADDIICHLRSERQAKWLKWSLEHRLAECGLELNQSKTRIVCCLERGGGTQRTLPSFDFLGYTFRLRRALAGNGKLFLCFLPAMSAKAAKAMSRTIRHWGMHRHTDLSLEELGWWCNRTVRGWINYYGHFHRSSMHGLFNQLDRILVRWALRKYKGLRGRRREAYRWLQGVKERQPHLFAHWHPW